jgi:hypothetical protein
MRFTKEDKHILLEVLRDEYKRQDSRFDKDKIVSIGHKLKMKKDQKISDLINVDFIYKELKKMFPLEFIDESWKKEIQDMIDIDGYSWDTILNVVRWARNDPFWKSQILSIKKLRKRDKEGVKYFDKLKYLMGQERKGVKEYTYQEVCDKVARDGFKMEQFEKKGKNYILIKK